MRYALGTSLALLALLSTQLVLHRLVHIPWRRTEVLALGAGALTLGVFVGLPEFRVVVRNLFFLVAAYSLLAWGAFYFLFEHLLGGWTRLERALVATTLFLLASPVFFLLWHATYYPIQTHRALEIFVGGVIPPGLALGMVPLIRHFVPASHPRERVGLAVVAYLAVTTLLVVLGGLPLSSVVGWIMTPGLVAFLFL